MAWRLRAFLHLGHTPSLVVVVAFLSMGMLTLGMGNGAVFQLVPQRFSREIGVLTGLVGAAGGLGGFLLPTLLGSLRELTGYFGNGFAVLSLAALGCLVLLRAIIVADAGWRVTWRTMGTASS